MSGKHTQGPWEVVPLSGYGGPFAIRMAMPEGAKHPTHYGVQAVGSEVNAYAIAALPELYAVVEALATVGAQDCERIASLQIEAAAALAKASP